MSDVNTPVIVDFPLRGEWMSPNTPGTRVPSHGTNRFGTRYAYDFFTGGLDTQRPSELSGALAFLPALRRLPEQMLLLGKRHLCPLQRYCS